VFVSVIPIYKRLAPSLHRLADSPADEGVDIDALVYCYKRLPRKVDRARTIYCAQRVDDRVAANAEKVTAAYRRRRCYALSESEVIFLQGCSLTAHFEVVDPTGLPRQLYRHT